MFSFEQGYSFCKMIMCKKFMRSTLFFMVIFHRTSCLLVRRKNVQIHKHTHNLLHLHSSIWDQTENFLQLLLLFEIISKTIISQYFN